MINKVKWSTFKSLRKNLLLTSLCILALLAVITLTGMTWNQPSFSLTADVATLTPTLVATPAPPSLLERFLQPTGDPASLTLGIIIMGGVIVLIILGGTFAFTRRKY
jgi:hypothetical protein